MSGCVYLSKTAVGVSPHAIRGNCSPSSIGSPEAKSNSRSGYGIGLAQSKYIINEHGGEIMVKSAEAEVEALLHSLFHVVD